MPVKWEYLEATFHLVENQPAMLFIVEQDHKYNSPVTLNKLGEEGWNLIGPIIDAATNQSRLVFRRSKT